MGHRGKGYRPGQENAWAVHGWPGAAPLCLADHASLTPSSELLEAFA
jgi:hypothetical protein